MANNVKEKVSEFFMLLLTIILDSLLVVIIATITYFVKWYIEMLYAQPIDKIDNIALFYIYSVSKYFLIIIVVLWAITDIFEEIRKTFKKFRDE